jgi:4-hydroxybenzoate polyprenyltransferase
MGDTALARGRGTAAILFDFSRGRQALLSIAQPALGGLLAAGAFPRPRVVLLGLVAAAAGQLCVFAFNDLLDVGIDREEVGLREGGGATSSAGSDGATSDAGQGGATSSAGSDGATSDAGQGGATSSAAPYDVDVTFVRHPLARGALSMRAAIAWVAALGSISLVAAYLLRPGCALLFAGCVALEAVYCLLKRRSWLKTVPAGAMVGLGGVAGWYAIRDLSWEALAVFLLLTMWEIAGRNLSNDLADRVADAPLGITSVATVFGPRASATGILVGAALMVPLSLLQDATPTLRVLLALAAVGAMAAPSLTLYRRPTEAQAQAYFNRATFYPPLAVIAAALVFAAQAWS